MALGRSRRKVPVVRLWTIQTVPAWEELHRDGVLRCRVEQASTSWSDGDEHWRNANEWMREQMARRMGPPPVPGLYPVWCWYWCLGKARPKPDMRERGFFLNKGQRGVRLTLECPDGSALLSDYNLWQLVLTCSHIAVSPVDDAAFDAELEARGLAYWDQLCDPEIAAGIRATWDRVFELAQYRHFARWNTEPDRRVIQATVWEVRMEWVRKVEEFVGR